MGTYAGFIRLFLGHREEQLDKTDAYAGEPGTTLKAIRLTDGDDTDKETWLQPGIATQDNEVVLYQQLSSVLGRGHLHAFLPGIVQITPDGYDVVLYADGTAGATVTVYGLQITGVPQGSSGTTTVLVNANTKESGITTNSIAATMAASAKSGKTAGSFEVTVGDPLYVHVTTTASHKDINVNVAYKGGGTS